jgi:hypothetical protein
VRSLPDLEAARSAALSRAAGLPRPSAQAASGDARELARAGRSAPDLGEVLRDGAEAIERLAAGAPVDSERHRIGLEAIVQLEGRPAIRIEGGHFAPPPAQWDHLERYRPQIEAVIAAVCRVQAPAKGSDWLATAFVVAPRVLLTNRHVAMDVATAGDGVSWTLDVDIDVDFRAEHPELAPGTAVTGVLGVHDEYDLALLGTSDELPGTPLVLAAHQPEEPDAGDVYVVGHPRQDGMRNDPVDMKRIFEGIFRVKRLQPGKAMGLRVHRDLDVLGHDCSTLGGNSGSCVVDLSSGRVAALHYWGDWKKVNYAVPLWRLALDPLLARYGVTFA